MPIVPFVKVVSFSSQDSKHPAINVLSDSLSKFWKCQSPEESNIFVILRLPKPLYFCRIDIGNERSAFIQVLVQLKGSSNKFQTILDATQFRTDLESIQDDVPRRVKCFTYKHLKANVRDHPWDTVKIVCYQQYNNSIQFGLAYFAVHAEENQQSVLKAQINPNEICYCARYLKSVYKTLRAALDVQNTTRRPPSIEVTRQAAALQATLVAAFPHFMLQAGITLPFLGFPGDVQANLTFNHSFFDDFGPNLESSGMELPQISFPSGNIEPSLSSFSSTFQGFGSGDIESLQISMPSTSRGIGYNGMASSRPTYGNGVRDNNEPRNVGTGGENGIVDIPRPRAFNIGIAPPANYVAEGASMRRYTKTTKFLARFCGYIFYIDSTMLNANAQASLRYHISKNHGLLAEEFSDIVDFVVTFPSSAGLFYAPWPKVSVVTPAWILQSLKL